MNNIAYALLKYSTYNLGDEIQSIAVKRFLPTVDLYIDRDNINETALIKETKLILNGWFTHKPNNWPPHNELLKPLIVSFHISNSFNSSLEKLVSQDSLLFFRKNEPIGTRDHNTMLLLSKNSIQSFYSGCMTLTLKSELTERLEDIVLVDVPNETIEKIPEEWRSQIKIKTHLSSKKNTEERFSLAQNLLNTYATAKLVITSRLHCALPCLAFNTPVIFIPSNCNDIRFSGVKDLFKHFYASEDFLNNKIKIDWYDIGSCKTCISHLRDSLVTLCKNYTGYDCYDINHK